LLDTKKLFLWQWAPTFLDPRLILSGYNSSAVCQREGECEGSWKWRHESVTSQLLDIFLCRVFKCCVNPPLMVVD